MSFNSLKVDREKARKACQTYIGKLNLLGLNPNTILRQKNGDEIVVNILEYAETQNYPRTLYVPSFVDHITDGFEYAYTRRTDDEAISRVKQIIIPDNIEMDHEAYRSLKGFPSLKLISISSRQKLLFNDVDVPYRVRIPEVTNMIATDKTKALMNFILEKGYSTIKGTDLMITYEVAGRAADEETALTVLCCQALESKMCLADDLQPYVDNEIIESVKSLYESGLCSVSEKALAIKTNTLLFNVFKLRKYVEKKYKLDRNRLLYEQIDYPGAGIFDIGQKFKPNLTIEGNCLQGFSDDGWLGYCEYTITGKVTPDQALDIIRLTNYYTCFEIEGFDLKPSYRHMNLDFFVQHWGMGNKAPVWCYPNGDIHCIGYTHGKDIQSIIIEACCLAAEFDWLSMSVTLHSQNKDYCSFKQDDITIDIENGSVKVYLGYSKILHDIEREYIAMIDNLRQAGKRVFTQEQLLTIQSRNNYESLLNTDRGKKQIEFLDMVSRFDMDIQLRLSDFTEETMGMKVRGRGIKNENLLRYIFDYDQEKLDNYFNEYDEARKKWLAEKKELEQTW